MNLYEMQYQMIEVKRQNENTNWGSCKEKKNKKISRTLFIKMAGFVSGLH